MAHLWVMPCSSISRSRWAALPLRSGRLELSPAADPPVRPCEGLPAASGVGLLIRGFGHGRHEQWLLKLLQPHGDNVRLNGAPVHLGQVLLRDRDEIRLPGARRLYLSMERVAEEESFPGAERPVFCARCKQEIAQDTPAVHCPGCGLWCHHTEEYPCWSYPGTSTCPGCDQPNDPQAGYRWIPEVM